MSHLTISEGGWMVIGLLFISTLDLYAFKLMLNGTQSNKWMYGGYNVNKVLINARKYPNLINIFTVVFPEQKLNKFPFILQSHIKIFEDSIVIVYPHNFTQDVHEMALRENLDKVGNQPSIVLSIGNNSTVFVKMNISPSTYSKVSLDLKQQLPRIYVTKSYIFCLATWHSFLILQL